MIKPAPALMYLFVSLSAYSLMNLAPAEGAEGSISQRLAQAHIIPESSDVGESEIGAFSVSVNDREFDLTAHRRGSWYRNSWGISYFVVDWHLKIRETERPDSESKRFHLQLKSGGPFNIKTLRVNGLVVERETFANRACTTLLGIQFCAKVFENPATGFRHKLIIMNGSLHGDKSP